MARLISKATGNFTAAGTWGLVDDTSYLDSETANTASTTSYVRSSGSTPGAITVDGVAVKVADLATGGGTVSIELWNDTDSVQVAEVTINVSDIADSNPLAAYNRGWYFFKFGASQLLVAGKSYKLGFKTSVTGTVFLYRDSTAGNWSRMLRTTTTQAPAASDQLHVAGEWTAAATLTSFTVTMDNTATTSFGPTVSGGPPQGITIGKGGTMTFGASASTNYYLKFKGVFAVFDGGTLNVGTSGTRMPSTSTAVLECDSVANVDTGLNIAIGGTLNMYGAQKDNFKSFLNTDEAAASTVLGISSTTDWANGDEICIASTTRTFSECEKRTISTVDSSTQVTISSGLTNAHSGTSPTQAEVGNLTRNVKFRGISDTLQGYVSSASWCTVTLRCVEFSRLGSATANKRGIDVANTAGTFDMQYCALRDFIVASSIGVNQTNATGSAVTISNNVFYNIHTSAYATSNATAGLSTVNNNLMMLNVSNSNPLANLLSMLIAFTNNSLAGCASTIIGGAALMVNSQTTGLGLALSTFSGNTVHSCAGAGVAFSDFSGPGTVATLTIWRCNSTGLIIGRSSSVANLNINDLTLFGNSGQNIAVVGSGTGAAVNVTFLRCTSNGDTTFSTTSGLSPSVSGVGASTGCVLRFVDSDFSTVAGIKTAHTNDIQLSGTNSNCGYVQIVLVNTKLGAATEIANQSNMQADSCIGSQKHDQTNGNHKSWRKTGTITIDTTIYDTSPSMRMTPNNASEKLESKGVSGGFRIAVASGATLTPSVKVRESVVGDGTDYNGNRARLVVKANPALGWASDVVLDTATVTSEGAWETLTGTTASAGDDGVAEIVVDCDGTTGWLNVDTWSVA